MARPLAIVIVKDAWGQFQFSFGGGFLPSSLFFPFVSFLV
jgi:hypothetical protein